MPCRPSSTLREGESYAEENKENIEKENNINELKEDQKILKLTKMLVFVMLDKKNLG